jgi:hypothetical protein
VDSKHTGMDLLDTEKAYATVWLNGLLFKLIFHLPDYLLFFLKSYLEGHTFTVHLTLYADDTALLSQSWQPDTVSHGLSIAVTTLHKYFTMQKL